MKLCEIKLLLEADLNSLRLRRIKEKFLYEIKLCAFFVHIICQLKNTYKYTQKEYLSYNRNYAIKNFFLSKFLS